MVVPETGARKGQEYGQPDAVQSRFFRFEIPPCRPQLLRKLGALQIDDAVIKPQRPLGFAMKRFDHGVVPAFIAGVLFRYRRAASEQGSQRQDDQPWRGHGLAKDPSLAQAQASDPGQDGAESEFTCAASLRPCEMQSISIRHLVTNSLRAIPDKLEPLARCLTSGASLKACDVEAMRCRRLAALGLPAIANELGPRAGCLTLPPPSAWSGV